MAIRKYLVLLFFIAIMPAAKAQQHYQQVDSTSNSYYLAGNWNQLIVEGQQAIASGTDFPMLRQRMGYAYFITGNYSAAIGQFAKVLKYDEYNQTARYYTYLCNRYLLRNAAAYYHAPYLDTLSDQKNLTPFGVIEIGAEEGLKFPEASRRGEGLYSRVFLSNRLGWRFSLDESVVHYRQSANLTELQSRIFGGRAGKTLTNQLEYFAKLNYTLSKQLVVFGGYHYLNSRYRNETYHNHVFVAGVKYEADYFILQADGSYSNITNTKIGQYNTQFSWYPLGNLNLYTVTRGSVLQQSNAEKGVFSQLVGGRVLKNTWLEGAVTLGTLNNYLEADGLYVYNAIDITKFKAGSTLYYQLNNHALLQLNYTYERKEEIRATNTYNQHSVTGGFTWRF